MNNISILMPCYNSSSTIEKAINSILEQQNWHELIIINDGSTDNTWQIVQKITLNNSKIKLINLGANFGAACARNIGAMYASGDIIGFLDADDEHIQGAYTLATEFLQALPQLAAVRFGAEFRNFPQELLQNNSEKINILLNTFIPNLFIRKSVFNILGGFPTDNVFRKYGGEDGILSFLLQKFFLVGTKYDSNGLIHNWHPNVHAQKFLETNLYDPQNKTEEVVIDSQILVEQKSQQIMQLINMNWNTQDKGFITLFKNEVNQEYA